MSAWPELSPRPEHDPETSVCAFTGGKNVPSARFRIRQLVAPLRSLGLRVDEFYPGWGKYPPRTKSLRPFWAAGVVAQLIGPSVRSWKYDVAVLQREMLSTFVTLEPVVKSPCVFDVDDAVWLMRGGKAAQYIARRSALIVAGNSVIAEYFGKINPNVVILPTAVDTLAYSPLEKNEHLNRPEEVAIGWIGTSGGLKYLYSIEPALKSVLDRARNARLRIVSDRAPAFETIDPDRVDYIPWADATEVELTKSFDIGIMPLDMSDWARGKCSFKMLCYMSCAKPVVVTPVGMNADVLAKGEVGLSAETGAEWRDALLQLVENRDLREAMGRRGRAVVEKEYSLNVIAPRYATLLRDVAGR